MAEEKSNEWRRKRGRRAPDRETSTMRKLTWMSLRERKREELVQRKRRNCFAAMRNMRPTRSSLRMIEGEAEMVDSPENTM